MDKELHPTAAGKKLDLGSEKNGPKQMVLIIASQKHPEMGFKTSTSTVDKTSQLST